MKKWIAMAMTIITLFAMPMSVFAAEVPTETESLYWEKEGTGVQEIEEIDPDIVVVVSTIEDNGVSTYDTPVGTDMSFDYHASLTGKWRYYAKNNFSVDITTNSDDSDGKFTLKLQRSGVLGVPVTVAKAELPQNGTHHVEFLYVNNPGDFRFTFNQPAFSSCHQWGSMTAWNWNY